MGVVILGLDSREMGRLTKPDLQGAEPATQRYLPIPIVCYCGGGERGWILKIGRRD